MQELIPIRFDVQNIGVCFIKVPIPLGSLDIEWWRLQCGLSMLIYPIFKAKMVVPVLREDQPFF